MKTIQKIAAILIIISLPGLMIAIDANMIGLKNYVILEITFLWLIAYIPNKKN